MSHLFSDQSQIKYVSSFQSLISTPCYGNVNAICWSRNLMGDFSEIIKAVKMHDNITVIEPEHLLEIELSQQGQLARDIILQDIELLSIYGASPSLNLIKFYERDFTYPFFPTDVYSFHVDRSSVPTDTFLCTYFGDASEILPNSQALQKIMLPDIRAELQKLHNGNSEDFETFLTEHFFDLHYLPKPTCTPISLGIGNLWKLAVDFPDSKSLPCIHRAPVETDGQIRLLLIC